jgi:hypothetical protein
MTPSQAAQNLDKPEDRAGRNDDARADVEGAISKVATHPQKESRI